MTSQWFSDARFGIFIHWGLYSLHGRCVWASYRERTPLKEYERLAERFDARDYQPLEWVDMALEAGARYMVLCTRQHPGFSLFDSKVSDFTAPNSAAKRDLVAEYVEACRKRGIRIGFYYSLLDWRYPAYFDGPEKNPEGWSQFLAYVHEQVRELCTNYGKLDILWYDGRWPYTAEDWRSEDLNAMVRDLQPDILINNRSGLPENFDTPEQRIPSRPEASRLWESCMTMNDHWAFCPEDRNWKTRRQLVQMLVKTACLGGNLLLDVGPKPGGAFPEEAVERLRAIGTWMKENGSSIYGAGLCPLNFQEGTGFNIFRVLSLMGIAGGRGNTVFLHVFHWPGREIVVASLKNSVRSARFLATGHDIAFRKEGDRLFLSDLPEEAPDPYDTVIVLELEGTPERYTDFRAMPLG
jgi:alpha-L-fucosidase